MLKYPDFEKIITIQPNFWKKMLKYPDSKKMITI